MAGRNKPVNVVQQIRNATTKKFSAEDKIRIVLEGLRAEIPITELCRREGISSAIYYKWSKDFLDAGKNGLTLQAKRNATSDEVLRLKSENEDLKKALAVACLKSCDIKKASASERRRYQRMSSLEKMEMLRVAMGSKGSIRKTLDLLDLPKSTYYRWRQGNRVLRLEREIYRMWNV